MMGVEELVWLWWVIVGGVICSLLHLFVPAVAVVGYATDENGEKLHYR
jgi:H+/Cl- antiporter ClcA